MDELAEDLSLAEEAEQLLDRTVAQTDATTLTGVALMVMMIVRIGQPSLDDQEFPWPQLRSVLADLSRLSAVVSI